MTVAIYPATANDFTTQGYGVLSDALSVTASEKAQQNGNTTLDLTMTYPVDGRYIDKIKVGNLIYYSGATDFLFEINEVDPDDSGVVTIYGNSADYRVMLLPFNNGGQLSLSGSVALVLAQAAKQVDFPPGFKLFSDVTQTVTIDDYFENFGAFITRLLSMVTAEVKHGVNGWSVLSKRGRDSDITLRDDKNTIGVTIKQSYTDIINKIVPLYKQPVQEASPNDDGQTTSQTQSSSGYVAGAPIISPNAFAYWSYYRGKSIKFDDELAAVGYFEKEKVDQPKVSADIKVQLADDEYKTLGMYDMLRVWNSCLGYYNKSIRVIEIDYDLLDSYQPITDIKVGDIDRAYYETVDRKIEDGVAEESEKRADAVDDAKKDAANAQASADGKSTNYYADDPPDDATGKDGDTYFQYGLNGKQQTVIWIKEKGHWVQQVVQGYDEALKKAIDENFADQENKINAAFSETTKLSQEIDETGTKLATLETNYNGFKQTVTDTQTGNESRFTQMSNLIQTKVSSDQAAAIASVEAGKIQLQVKSDGYSSYLSLNGGRVDIGGDMVHITGRTVIDNGVINSAKIGDLDAGKITSGTIRGIDIIGSNHITLGSPYGGNIDLSSWGVTLTGNGGGHLQVGSPSTTGSADIYGGLNIYSGQGGTGGISMQGNQIWMQNGAAYIRINPQDGYIYYHGGPGWSHNYRFNMTEV
ncbi:gp58-like family protein [Lacticaseibacillus brantae]|uniref:Gp58-like domain-containing protein n=1 Tax=Lacticaseibacillus brantae DSM 23927 TaxID=1423727 RepID=A0A0R2B921_9LACO|nr:gp58-like family protein [Lacticaseibacillus brantae]KRM73003.1 hypothetical protein FC34_GL000722 [Lacticaseibacillus brantae DSM 23927]